MIKGNKETDSIDYLLGSDVKESLGWVLKKKAATGKEFMFRQRKNPKLRLTSPCKKGSY